MIDPSKFGSIINKYKIAVDSVGTFPKYYDSETGLNEPGGEPELEIRFGKYYDKSGGKKKYISGVQHHEFSRLFDNISFGEPEMFKDEHFLLSIAPSPNNPSSTRTIGYRRSIWDDGYAIWIIKNKCKMEEGLSYYPQYRFKLGIATEEYVVQDDDNIFFEDKGIMYRKERETKPVPLVRDIVREKKRYQSKLSSENKIIATEVTTSSHGEIREELKTTYEVEIEFGGSVLDQRALEILNEDIEYVFKKMYGTYNIYTEGERTRMIEFVNGIHGNSGKREIAKNIMTKARNLKYGDLQIGGIYGGKTGYSVTDKADGERYLMIVDTSGVWLASPEFRYNLAQRINWSDEDYHRFGITNDIIGLICDGEDIPKSSRIEAEPDLYSWFHIFDILAKNGSTNVQQLKSHEKRRQKIVGLVEVLNEILKNDPYLRVKIKTFYGINSVNQFFDQSNKVLRTNRPYKTDGLIYTPTNTIYNITKERSKIPLDNRILTKYPDLCKWKPDITIDLAIGQDRNLKTVTFKNGEAVYLDFIGTDIVPFNPSNYERIIADDSGYLMEDLDSLPGGKVAEFKWENLTLVPIKIRHDKKYPNPEWIAKDNWKSILNGIDEATIKGHTTKLLRKYHNRIKRRLFESLPEGSTLLDIASGTGGDVTKWERFDKIVAVEPELSHIEDTVKGGTLIRGLRHRVEVAGMSNKVKIVQARGQDYQLISQEVKKFIGGKVDYCSIMLGLSFFWDSEVSFNSLVKTIEDNVKESIIYLTIDGDAVKQLWDPPFSQIGATDRLTIGNPENKLSKLDFIEYNPKDPKGPVKVNIGDIVDMQYEHLVNLGDLMRFFSTNQIYRADKEDFLNKGERVLTSLYSYGIFDLDHPKIKYKRKTPDVIITSTPSIDEIGPGSELEPAEAEPEPEQIEPAEAEPEPEIIGSELDRWDDMPQNIRYFSYISWATTLGLIGNEWDTFDRDSLMDSMIGHDLSAYPEIERAILDFSALDNAEKERMQNEWLNNWADVVPPGLEGLARELLPPPPQPSPPQPSPPQPSPPQPSPPTFEIATDSALIQTRRDAMSHNGISLTMISSKIISGKEVESTARLNVKWFDQQDVMRISVLGDGSCYLHSYLKGFYRRYQDNPDKNYRFNTILDLRRDLALQLTRPNPVYRDTAYADYYWKLIDSGETDKNARILADQAEQLGQMPKYSYWLTNANGRNIDVLTQQIIEPNVVRQGYDFADLTAMQRDLNSRKCLSDLHIMNISDMMGVDVIIFHGYTDNVTLHLTTYLEGRDRPIVCIIHIKNSVHYELIGVTTPDGIQTTFRSTDPFIQALFELYPADAYVVKHPYDVMMEAVIKNYEDYDKKVDGNIIVPNILDVTLLNENDPYVQTLYAAFDDAGIKFNDRGELIITSDKMRKIKETLIQRGFIGFRQTN